MNKIEIMIPERCTAEREHCTGDSSWTATAGEIE